MTILRSTLHCMTAFPCKYTAIRTQNDVRNHLIEMSFRY